MRWLGAVACALVVGLGIAQENERSIERLGYVSGFYFIRSTGNNCEFLELPETFASDLQDKLDSGKKIDARVEIVRALNGQVLGFTVKVRKNKSKTPAQEVIQEAFTALLVAFRGTPLDNSSTFPVPRHAASSSTRHTWGRDRIDQHDRPLDHDCFTPVGTGANVTVYVLDSGVNPNHSEFREGQVKAFEPGTQDRQDLNDLNGHGTYVAALIAGKTLGVAPEATIVSMQVLDADGFLDELRLLAALEDVAASLNGESNVIVNLSMTGPRSGLLQCAIRRLTETTHAIVVGAAGNTNGGNAGNYFPGALDDIITVGSSTKRDRRAVHSAAGASVDIYAPGVSIRSASSRSIRNEIILGGTSAAAAYVSGSLAAILSSSEIGSGLKTAKGLREYLCNSGKKCIKDGSSQRSTDCPEQSAPQLRPLLYVGEELKGKPVAPESYKPQALIAPPDPPEKQKPVSGVAIPHELPIDLAASVVYANTSNEELGYGPVDALIDRETRLSVGRAWQLRHSWRVAPVLEIASRMADGEHLLDSGRYQLGGDASYTFGEHELGFGARSARYERNRESSFTSNHATLGYGWTPGAGGSCTPMTLGVYADHEWGSDKQVGSPEVFDQSGAGSSLALRFMNERPKRGTTCAYGSLLSAPAPSTGRWLDFWAGVQNYKADGRAWDSRGWFLRGKTSFSIGKHNLYIEPSFLFAMTSFDNTLEKRELGRSPEDTGLDWTLPDRFQRDRAWSLGGRYTIPAGPHLVIDVSLTLAREHRFSNVDFLSNDRKVIQFGITVRPANVLNKKWGGATGGGTTVVVGGGGASGGPRPDPTVNCTAPPPC